jgi:hypothetical protein
MPEDGILHSRRCENFKSYTVLSEIIAAVNIKNTCLLEYDSVYSDKMFRDASEVRTAPIFWIEEKATQAKYFSRNLATGRP